MMDPVKRELLIDALKIAGSIVAACVITVFIAAMVLLR